MSADNGVYILATKGEHGEKEYRVAYAQAIANITWAPDYPSPVGVLNTGSVLMRFGNSRVFTDRRLAEGYAIRVEEEVGYTKYGIVYLDHTNVHFPKERRMFARRVSYPLRGIKPLTKSL